MGALKSSGLRTHDALLSGYRHLAAWGLRGDAVECPCCDLHVRFFAGQKHAPNRVCWRCGSLERHRALKLYLDEHPEMLAPGMKVLHVAPEPPIAPVLRAAGVEYHGGDLERRFGPELIDVTSIAYPDGTFDAVVCNHVLEHVPDDAKALSEIRRVLKPDGWTILLIPSIRQDTTVEDPAITDRAERERLFGQVDHVRRYGWDYLDRLERAGLTTEVVRPEEQWSQSVIDRYRLSTPRGVDPIFIARPSS